MPCGIRHQFLVGNSELAQSIGAGLTPNDEEAPEVDQDTSRKVDVIASSNELVIDTTQDSKTIFSKRDQK